MALQHILDAIVHDADSRIQHISTASKQRLKDAKEASEKRLRESRQKVADNLDLKKRQLKEKTLSYALMKKRKVMLEHKQQHMNDLYEQVLGQLEGLSKEQAEQFLEACLKVLPSTGTIRPSKAHEAMLKKLLPKGCDMGDSLDARGGFVFSNDTQEFNFTFEHLVQHVLRPKTEVEIAHELFPSQK